MDFTIVYNNVTNIFNCKQTSKVSARTINVNNENKGMEIPNADLKSLVIKLAHELERIKTELELLKKKAPVEETLDDSIIHSMNPETLAEFLSVLSSPERLMILKFLYVRDRYFSELEELLDVGPSSLRHHLSKLINFGLIIQERIRGKYKISEKGRQVLRVLAELYERFVKR